MKTYSGMGGSVDADEKAEDMQVITSLGEHISMGKLRRYEDEGLEVRSVL